MHRGEQIAFEKLQPLAQAVVGDVLSGDGQSIRRNVGGVDMGLRERQRRQDG
jgi:hypothetical protein